MRLFNFILYVLLFIVALESSIKASPGRENELTTDPVKNTSNSKKEENLSTGASSSFGQEEIEQKKLKILNLVEQKNNILEALNIYSYNINDLQALLDAKWYGARERKKFLKSSLASPLLQSLENLYKSTNFSNPLNFMEGLAQINNLPPNEENWEKWGTIGKSPEGQKKIRDFANYLFKQPLPLPPPQKFLDASKMYKVGAPAYKTKLELLFCLDSYFKNKLQEEKAAFKKTIEEGVKLDAIYQQEMKDYLEIQKREKKDKSLR